MKVKIHIPCYTRDDNLIEITLDAELSADCLDTVDGFADIVKVDTPRIDCMPEIRKE